MRVDTVKLPRPDDLTLPRPASTTVRTLFSMALAQAIDVARRLSTRTDAGRTLRERVWPALSKEPGLLAWIMAQPSRMTYARCLALVGDATPADRATWEERLAGSLVFDAVRAGLVEEASFATGPRKLTDERARVAFDVPAAGTLRVSGDLVELDGRRLEPVTASLPLFAEAKLALVDENPLSEFEAHPDKHGNTLSLGEKPAGDWVAALSEAFALVERHLPGIAAEMRLLLRHVVPVGWDEQKHLSASYLEAPGVVYLTLHPQPMTMVEALIHEFQHNKLNLLLGFDPVLRNGFEPLFTSPVRPDPRPLRGVVLAVHAFQPVARLYEAMIAEGHPREVELRRRLGQVAKTCHEGCEVVLPNAVPTGIGAPLFDEMASLDVALAKHLSP